MQLKTSYAVITGASSGIGTEFAKRFSNMGYPLVLIARREDRLKELAKQLKTPCLILPADLSKEEECYRVYYELKERQVTFFINNAGFGDCGDFAETKLQKDLDMIQVNVKAVHIFLKLMLQKMEAAGRGYILNVASSAGLLPAGPYMATYYATKAYVTSLTRAVAEELSEKGSSIYVGCLCPGPVDTEFNSRANVKFALPGISASECVSYTLQQMKKKKVVIVPTYLMQAAVVAGRVLPPFLTAKLTAHQQKKKLYH